MIGLVFTFGPREPVDETITFKAEALGSDLDQYLQNREKNIENLVAGAQKQIIWHDAQSKQKTPYSIVYLHGFSATLEEIRPVPDLIAKQLGANLYYARLTGHGRDGDAMATATVNDWFNDTAEALAIGKALGQKTIVLSVSTGGTLVAWAASKPELIEDVAGMIFVSPNFGLNNPAAPLLNFGAARTWLPWLVGAERSFPTKNEGHAKWWTNSYPTVAALPMAASVKHVNTLEFEDINIPALFIYHPEDKVVRPDITKEIAGRWGNNHKQSSDIHEVTSSQDEYNHVIAGRVLSPANSEPLAGVAVDWAKGL